MANKKSSTRSPRKSASSTAHRSPATRSNGSESEAIAQLTEDHARVKKLFKQYDKLAKADADGSERQELASKICAELTAHADAEEEILYPAVREALDDASLIDEAEVEHATARELIAQIQDSSPDDELFDAKVKVLGEYINHHVEEEEGEIFPKIRKGKIDTVSLGEEIAARKAEILDGLGMEVAA